MPDRLILLWHSIETIAMTLISFLIMVSFTSILTAIPSILAILYWIPKIKKEQVEKYHSGSWWKWIKSFINK